MSASLSAPPAAASRSAETAVSAAEDAASSGRRRRKQRAISCSSRFEVATGLAIERSRSRPLRRPTNTSDTRDLLPREHQDSSVQILSRHSYIIPVRPSHQNSCLPTYYSPHHVSMFLSILNSVMNKHQASTSTYLGCDLPAGEKGCQTAAAFDKVTCKALCKVQNVQIAERKKRTPDKLFRILNL